MTQDHQSPHQDPEAQSRSVDRPQDPTTATAGAWKGLLDCEQLEEEVYQSRLQNPRPEVRL